jgi:site-specific DNA-methyltransferase (adenine-specific)
MDETPVVAVATAELQNLPPVIAWPRYTISDFTDRIICGNCVNVMREMPSASVDFVLTDPPYGSRYRDRSDRTVTNDDSTTWLAPAFAEIGRVLKQNSFCVSFYGWSKVDVFMAAWRAAGLRPRAHLVWPKSYASLVRVVGYCHEQAYLLSKGEPANPKTILKDVLSWKYTGNHHHPTQKPIIALKPLIEAVSEPQSIVLDPVAGSGSTAVASLRCDRRYIAIEIERSYCETARTRLCRTQTQGGG